MPDSNRHKSRCEALNDEAENLHEIAKRLAESVIRFEAYLETSANDVATAYSSLSTEGSLEQCQELARKLEDERELLITAWELLEQEQRRLRVRTTTTDQRVPSRSSPTSTERNILPPATPVQPSNDTSLSKCVQFQQLQREIDRRISNNH